jgi:hypothetical protein
MWLKPIHSADCESAHLRWAELAEPIDDEVFWTTYEVEVEQLVAIRASQYGLRRSGDRDDCVSETLSRTMARLKSEGAPLRLRLRIGALRRAFAEGCLKNLHRERIRRIYRERGEAAAIPTTPDDQIARACNAEVRQICERLAEHEPQVALAMRVCREDGRQALVAYQTEFGLSARSVRRHYLNGLERLRAELVSLGLDEVKED